MAAQATSRRKPTIYEALVDKLGRVPTNAELKADVERIKREALVMVAGKGKLKHQRRNPKSPALMTAGEINKAIDKIDAAESKLTREFIDAGRGHERPSEYLKMNDPLANRAKELFNQRSALQMEKELRYGPGAPSRLPKGFGPRKSNPESASASMYSSFHGTPSTAIDEYEEREHYHSNLAALGELVGLKVRTVSGYDVTLGFESGTGRESNPQKWLLPKRQGKKNYEDVGYLPYALEHDIGFGGDKMYRPIKWENGTATVMSSELAGAHYDRYSRKSAIAAVKYLAGGMGNKSNPGFWPFNSFTRTTIMHVPSGHKFHTATEYKHHTIYKSESKDGYVVPGIERDSVFDSVKDAKKFIDHWVKARPNPKGGKGKGGPFASSQRFVGDTVGAIYRPIDAFTGMVAGVADKGLRAVGVKGNPYHWPWHVSSGLNVDRTKVFEGPNAKEEAFAYAQQEADSTGWQAYVRKGTPGSMVKSKQYKVKPSETRRVSTLSPLATRKLAEYEEKLKRENPGRRSNPDHTLLTSNEDGTQLYLVGGPQDLDLNSLKIDGEAAKKDLVTVGQCWGICYRTTKHWSDKDVESDIEYVHIFGKKETKPKRGGDLWEDAVPPPDATFYTDELPTLTYDRLNEKQALVGGSYKIDRPLFGVSPGIEG